MPASYAAGDILLLLVNTANEAVSTPGGWAQVANSPQGTGTGGSAGAVRLYAFWKVSAVSESSVAITDAGSYTAGQMFSFYNADTAGPINVTAGAVQATAATAWTCPAVTTTIPNCLVLLCIGNDRDSATDNTLLSGWTNANLSSLTEREDETGSSGTGGGFGLATGIKSSTGDTGTTAVTSASSVTAAFLTIALAPFTTFSDGITETAATGATHEGYKNVTESEQEESVAAGDTVAVAVPPVTRVGDVVSINTADYSGSTTVTVPSDAEFAVLFVHGRASGNAAYASTANSVSLGGDSFTWQVRTPNYYNALGGAAFTLANPQTGSQTLAWSVSTGIVAGIFITAAFYKNVSLTAPILGVGSAGVDGVTPTTVSVTGLPTSLGSMTVGAACSIDTADIGYYGLQTVFFDDTLSAFGGIRGFAGQRANASIFALTGTEVGGVLAVSLWEGDERLTLDGGQEESAGIAETQIGQSDDEYQEADSTETSALSEEQTGAQVYILDDSTTESLAVTDAATGIDVEVIAESAVAHQFSGDHIRIVNDELIVIYPDSFSNDSYSVTIPAGTNLVLAFFYCSESTYCDPDDYAFTLGGYSFSHITDSDDYVACAKLINPPTGEQTFTWFMPGNPGADKTFIALACLTNVDVSTDPIIDFGERYDVSWLVPADITGLSYESEKDLCIGLVCSDSFDGNMVVGVPAQSPIIPRGVQQKVEPFLDSPRGSPKNGRMAVNWGVSTFSAYTTMENARSSCVAVTVRGLDLGAIEQGGFDRGVIENAFVADVPVSPSSIDAEGTDSTTIRTILGPYVDIPERLLLSDPLPRPYHMANMKESPTSSFYVYPAAGANLIVVAYITSRAEATWHYEGNYTLTLNGVPFTHLYNTVGKIPNLVVAYLKDPTPGVLVGNFPNPYLPRVEDDWTEPSDMWAMMQFMGVDTSGNPIRSSAYVHDVDPGEGTVSGLTFEEGDLTMAIGTGNFTDYPTIGERHIVSSWVFHVSMGWYMAISAGGIPAGATSISGDTVNPGNALNLFGMVIKLDPTLYEAFIQAAEREESLTVAGTHDGTSSPTEDADRAESAAIAADQDGGQAHGSSLDDGLTVQVDQSSMLAGNRMGYAWAIARASQSATQSADGSSSDTLTPDEAIAAWHGLYASMTDETTVEEIASAYNIATGSVAEALATGDESTTIAVMWGFSVETSFAVDVPTNTANMNADRVELFTILDGYSAIRIECYFPEMTVTYGKAEYTATPDIPAIEAVFSREAIMATFQQDNEVEAIFNQDDYTATLSVPEVEAVYAGAVVATLSPSTYIATKGE